MCLLYRFVVVVFHSLLFIHTTHTYTHIVEFDELIDWLCFHTPEDELPEKYKPKADQVTHTHTYTHTHTHTHTHTIGETYCCDCGERRREVIILSHSLTYSHTHTTHNTLQRILTDESEVEHLSVWKSLITPLCLLSPQSPLSSLSSEVYEQLREEFSSFISSLEENNDGDSFTESLSCTTSISQEEVIEMRMDEAEGNREREIERDR